MKARGALKGILSLVLAVILVVSAGCSGNANNGSDETAMTEPAATDETSSETTDETTSEPVEEPAEEPAAATKEPITLKVQLNSTGPDFEGTEVYNEIVKQTGVTMDIEQYDEEKFKVQLAGGDLPDIIQVDLKYLKQLIEGGNIIPLDDLVASNGTDVTSSEVNQKSLAYSKQFWSNDTGKLYLIPVQVGESGFGFEQTIGFTTRWDYYKELGYPEIKNIDDMVNVLAQMIEKHPTTADGKKVYGAAIWNDWGTWGLASMGMLTGNGTYNVNTGQLANNYTDPTSSSIWDTAQFLYKAKQKGILDPDAFTAKYDDIVAKVSQGTLISNITTWPMAQANAELLKEGADKGFMAVPLEWGFNWNGGTTIAGWNGKAFAITKNAKNPERAMDLINFLKSEQGSRLIASGIQGVHWDLVDGKPQMKQEIVQLKASGTDEEWKKTGISGRSGGMANQQGYTDYTKLADGGFVNLFNTAEVFALQNNSLHNDFNAHYGVSYPAEAFEKRVAEGKVKSLNAMPQDVLAAMPPQPDDIKRIVTKLDEMVIKGIPQVVLNSKNDAEYEANQKKLIDELNAAGADKYFEWYKKAYEETQAKFN